MLTWEDCVALCELTEAEIAAIAEHEHIPMLVAAELGNYLVHTPSGQKGIKRMILDDIAAAQARGDITHAVVLKLVLKRFVEEHADARNGEPSIRPATSGGHCGCA
ncbi:MAG: hypothetical protein ACOY3L_09175 [Pseudomonadota bacterium]